MFTYKESAGRFVALELCLSACMFESQSTLKPKLEVLKYFFSLIWFLPKVNNQEKSQITHIIRPHCFASSLEPQNSRSGVCDLSAKTR